MDSQFVGVGISIVDVTAAAPALRELTPFTSLTNNPDWSPRGDLIVVSKPDEGAGIDGPADLYTMAPDGTGLTRVTAMAATRGRAIQPTFTPDGARILFCPEVSAGNGTLASILLDGGAMAPATGSDYVPGVHPKLQPTP